MSPASNRSELDESYDMLSDAFTDEDARTESLASFSENGDQDHTDVLGEDESDHGQHQVDMPTLTFVPPKLPEPKSFIAFVSEDHAEQSFASSERAMDNLLSSELTTITERALANEESHHDKTDQNTRPACLFCDLIGRAFECGDVAYRKFQEMPAQARREFALRTIFVIGTVCTSTLLGYYLSGSSPSCLVTTPITKWCPVVATPASSSASVPTVVTSVSSLSVRSSTTNLTLLPSPAKRVRLSKYSSSSKFASETPVQLPPPPPKKSAPVSAQPERKVQVDEKYYVYMKTGVVLSQQDGKKDRSSNRAGPYSKVADKINVAWSEARSDFDITPKVPIRGSLDILIVKDGQILRRGHVSKVKGDSARPEWLPSEFSSALYSGSLTVTVVMPAESAFQSSCHDLGRRSLKKSLLAPPTLPFPSAVALREWANTLSEYVEAFHFTETAGRARAAAGAAATKARVATTALQGRSRGTVAIPPAALRSLEKARSTAHAMAGDFFTGIGGGTAWALRRCAVAVMPPVVGRSVGDGLARAQGRVKELQRRLSRSDVARVAANGAESVRRRVAVNVF